MTTVNTASLYEKHKSLLNDAVNALEKRTFYSPYPEHPKAYAPEGNEEGKTAFSSKLNENYTELGIDTGKWIGEEVSPFWQTGLGIQYPSLSVDQLIENSAQAQASWTNVSVNERAGILTEALENISHRYFEIAYATMHTSGQSFMMAFQASGPHANDRALEAVAMGLSELNRYPTEVDWVKPMGKFDLTLKKNWKSVPKGIGVVIGCSTFPIWNTVPGLFANLISGNVSIVKPHPKAVLPIAIVVAEIRKVLTEQGLDANIVQLAVDTQANPITKQLCEHTEVKLIDYTGGNAFGDYVESLGKENFTEKAGVNTTIIDSSKDLKAVMQNIAFSASLYSGQMCTAPQNIYIPKTGVKTAEGVVSFDEAVDMLGKAIEGLVNHPKMGAGTLGAIQNDNTVKNIKNGGDFGGEIIVQGNAIDNPEFENARMLSPTLIKITDPNNTAQENECFGPLIMAIQTESTEDSVNKAAALAKKKGAITCLAFATDKAHMDLIETGMNNAYTPVSFNLGGAAFVNQHAAFSDFHVSGGNPAGNASFTNPEYIHKRVVWIGNRYMG